ncbi:MAG: LemA family protein, partial [Chitinophagaceae bacterium]|nr:LemA family protein [Chitinophagaceae bacterium]
RHLNFKTMPILIVVGILVLIVIWLVSLYNGLVRLRNRRQNAFADIDVQLRQRHDLVPQLVETVKGYAAHEKELLLKVTEARTAAMAATTIDGKIAAEQQLSSALQGLKVQVEAYPDLKANQNFLQLQEELSDIENKLAASRRFFNGATTEYNNAVEAFPGNLIAKNFGFKREVLFDLGEDTRKQMDEPPKIQF